MDSWSGINHLPPHVDGGAALLLFSLQKIADEMRVSFTPGQRPLLVFQELDRLTANLCWSAFILIE